MKEIGGYFELECGHSMPYHENAVLLNSARNALRYIVRAYDIKKIYVPFYTCPVVWQALTAEQAHLTYYDINENLEIDLPDIPSDAFILINNYFGIQGKYVAKMAQKYPNLIIDNAQAFYAQKQGLAAFYSPRKFFGLPDGGLCICDKSMPDDFEQSVSYDLCTHLLKRHDLGAGAGYADFQKNDEALVGQPIQKMSKLTQALMGNIDYEQVRQQRLENFHILHKALKSENELKIDLATNDVPMVYPFLTKAQNLREKLIQNKIFVARYWPEIEKVCPAESFSVYLQNHLFPLPIDQRYNIDDMKRILEVILCK